MNAVTQQFILPITPTTTQKKLPIVYPWEQTNLYNLCLQLYELARNTGYESSFDEFKAHFGEYLESDMSVVGVDEYNGQYTVTPLPTLEQILRTSNKLLKHDIVIDPIPYSQTSNLAGGYTVTIG